MCHTTFDAELNFIKEKIVMGSVVDRRKKSFG